MTSTCSAHCGMRRQRSAPRVLAADAARQSVLTTVVNGIASAYFTLQELPARTRYHQSHHRQSQSQPADRSVAGNRRNRDAPDQRQAETALYTATAQLPDIDRQIDEQEDLIAKLLGRYPAPIARGLPIENQLADVTLSGGGTARPVAPAPARYPQRGVNPGRRQPASRGSTRDHLSATNARCRFVRGHRRDDPQRRRLRSPRAAHAGPGADPDPERRRLQAIDG